MTVTRNGEPAGDYGRQDAVPGELALSYGAFYGGDDGEIIFDTGRTDRGNLLVIGESYDNAILKLLAPTLTGHIPSICATTAIIWEATSP